MESKAIDPTPAHGAQRELTEEANISIPVDAFTPVGTLSFTFQDNEEKMVVHLFHVNVQFQENIGNDDQCKDAVSKNSSMPGVIIDPNTIKGCDEITPKWFSLSEIPLQQMFADDSVWLTHFLSERAGHDNTPIKMSGWFHFSPGGDENNQIQHYFLDT